VGADQGYFQEFEIGGIEKISGFFKNIKKTWKNRKQIGGVSSPNCRVFTPLGGCTNITAANNH